MVEQNDAIIGSTGDKTEDKKPPEISQDQAHEAPIASNDRPISIMELEDTRLWNLIDLIRSGYNRKNE